jgi:hypothetical protein
MMEVLAGFLALSKPPRECDNYRGPDTRTRTNMTRLHLVIPTIGLGAIAMLIIGFLCIVRPSTSPADERPHALSSSGSTEFIEYVNQTSGTRFAYPTGWSLADNTSSAGLDVTISSAPFREYGHGGILPIGAAAIRVFRMQSGSSSPDMEHLAAKQLEGVQVLSRAKATVGPWRAYRTEALSRLGPNRQLRETAIYITAAGSVYELQLTCDAKNENSALFVAILEKLALSFSQRSQM